MSKKQLFTLGLPKWPALIVKGEKVTIDQAKEILIRTGGSHFSSNDHVFDRNLILAFYGIECDMYDLRDYIKNKYNGTIDPYEFMLKTAKEWGVLTDLHYLENRRVVSCWIGGPHGWCNWDGHIGSTNYNIGKWPSIEDVYNEWVIIAKAFPYLDLKCQLLSGETCQENIEPVVEYTIKNGEVDISKPKEFLAYPTDDTAEEIGKFFSNPYRERGCTIDQFKDALAHTATKVNNSL